MNFITFQVNTFSKMARWFTRCWKSQFHHNINFIFSHKCQNFYHHFVTIKKLQIIVGYISCSHGTNLLVHCNSASGFITKIQQKLLSFWKRCWYYFYLTFDVSVKDTQGKQHLERKFKKCEYRSFPSRCIKTNISWRY